MFYVAHDSDNRFPMRGGVARPSYMCADGVLVREKVSNERFIHNHDNRSVFAILRGKVASAEQRDTDDGKIIAKDRARLDIGFFPKFHGTPFDGQVVVKGITAHGQLADHCSPNAV